jgi:transposase-like protein
MAGLSLYQVVFASGSDAADLKAATTKEIATVAAQGNIRTTALEAWVADFERDRLQRRTENDRNTAEVKARLAEVERDTRAAGNLGDRNSQAIAGLQASGQELVSRLDKLTAATQELALQVARLATIIERQDAGK